MGFSFKRAIRRVVRPAAAISTGGMSELAFRTGAGRKLAASVKQSLGLAPGESVGANFANINARIAEIEAQRKRKEAEEQAKRTKLSTRLRENVKKEEQAALSLIGTREKREADIGRALEERLAGADIRAEEEGIETGEAFAERGLTRSSFAQRGQEEVELRRLGSRAEAQQLADREIARGVEAEKRVRAEIERRREQTELDIEFGELSALTRQREFLSAEAATQRFNAEFTQLQLDSARKQAMAQTFGSLAGSAAMIFALCWVARAVLGKRTSEWEHSRNYILFDSPLWLLKFYVKNGKKIAYIVSKRPLLKLMLRPLFKLFAWKGYINGL